MPKMPDNLPRLTSYEKTLEHFKSIKPYSKGKQKGSVPLGSVRAYTRSLITHRGDHFAFSYYGFDVVKLYEDGTREFNACGWHSISTCNFLNDTSSDVNIYFARIKNTLYLVKNKIHYMFPDGHSPIKVSPDGIVSGYKVPVCNRMNGEVMSAFRKRYAPFTTFLRDMLTINPHVPDDRELDALHQSMYRIQSLPIGKSISSFGPTQMKDSTYSIESLFNFIDKALLLDEQERADCFYQIATRFTFIAWCWVHGNTYTYTANAPRIFLADEAVRHFEELIKLRYSNMIFTEVAVPPRETAVHDSNRHYKVYQSAFAGGL